MLGRRAENHRRQSCAGKATMRPAITLETLLGNRRILLPLADDTALKPVDQHRSSVNPSAASTFRPRSAVNSFMCTMSACRECCTAASCVRPIPGIDSGEFIGRSLEAVDRASLDGIPGIRAVVVEGDFVGIVAEREEYAVEAAHKLKVSWKTWRTWIRPRRHQRGASRQSGQGAAPRRSRRRRRGAEVGGERGSICSYVWPYQMHALDRPVLRGRRRDR